MNERDRMLKLVERAMASLARREDALARSVLLAYERARKELLGELQDAMARLGPDPSPAQLRALALNRDLVEAIDRRLTELAREVGEILDTGLKGVVGQAGDDVLAELNALLVDVPRFPFAMNQLLELTVTPVLDQVPGLTSEVTRNLVAELRVSLARGDRMGDIATRLLGKEAGVFKRGMTSAELMTRRAVIDADNMARDLWMEAAQENEPALQRQAIASVSGRTTKTCLRVHGQIRDIGEPFDLTAEPRYARKMMRPSFHWRCRTGVFPYLARFEEDSGLKTSDMRDEAKAELKKREG